MSDQKKTDSVFDILYADIRRLSSLLSQLSDDGVVTELSRVASESTRNRLGFSIKIVKGDTSDTGTTSTTLKIDPQWLLPFLFLDAAQGIIRRDITQAEIGSLVLATGKLVVTDLNLLKQMWQSPAMKRQILAGMVQADQPAQNRQERRASSKQPRKDMTEQEAILEMLPLLPHVAQANIVTEDYAVWSTIEPDYLVGTIADIMLKHGAKVAGSWSMVGILDGVPFEERDDADYDEFLSGIEQIRLGMTTENLWKVATELAPAARGALGRPILSYAMTPLIIFREIERLPKSN